MENNKQKKGTGLTAGIIASVLAILGIFFIGLVFIPLAIIVAFIGSFIAIKNKNIAGIGVNLLAWVLVFVGVVSSPMIYAIIGFSSYSEKDSHNNQTIIYDTNHTKKINEINISK